MLFWGASVILGSCASVTSLSTHLLNFWAPFSHRSAYCAASVASLTNILTPALFAGTAEWIAR